MSILKKFWLMFFLTAFIVSTSTPAFAQNNLDWEKGVIRVAGLAAGPQISNNTGNFSRKYSQEAAKLDALRILNENIAGLIIENFDGADEFQVEESNTIKLFTDDITISAIVAKGARLINSTFFTDNTCEVTMEMPLFGKNSVAEVVFSKLKNGKKNPFPNPTNTVELGNEKYTGLIVDCRELNFSRTISLLIENENEISIYSGQNLDYSKVFNKVVNSGMVEYTADISRQTRAGSSPLTVKAVNFKNNKILIPNADADKILTANQKFHFLDKCAVVIVY